MLLLLLIILLTLFANSILWFLGNFVLPSFSPNIDGRKRPKRRWNILSSFCLADVGSSSLSFYFSFKSSEWTQNSGRLITLSLQSGEIGWQSSIIRYFASNCRSETQTRCLHRARRDPWDLTTDITKKKVRDVCRHQDIDICLLGLFILQNCIKFLTAYWSELIFLCNENPTSKSRKWGKTMTIVETRKKEWK